VCRGFVVGDVGENWRSGLYSFLLSTERKTDQKATSLIVILGAKALLI